MRRLMRAAELDRYEQGDTWAKVRRFRPADSTVPTGKWDAFNTAVVRLITVDTRPETAVRATALRHVDDWLTAFEQAGHVMHTLANEGRLTRGLRAVIAHHIIFHWNRIGIPHQAQANIALAAKESHLRQLTSQRGASRSVRHSALTRSCSSRPASPTSRG